ncbi:MAG: PD40 domain-containing protein [Bacteroidetes bacterium]|nr:PD40 domain-containing protein [Bacteroidota bacterium]
MKVNLLVAMCLAGHLFYSQEEKHLKDLKMLTHGGDNAEAYFSFDGKHASFQSNNKKWDLKCDQIFNLDIANAEKDSTYKPNMISNGKGRTTCSYFLKDNKHILFASTFKGGDDCPAVVEIKGKYLWAVYKTFDIYVADLKGNISKQLTNTDGYDAEATVSPKGDKIVFTSDRSGDLELWTMDVDGKNQKQITFGLGYDGGAFFSPDGKKIVFRASRPTEEMEVKEYKELLAQGLVAPTSMELYTCNVDGSNLKQVTHLGKANWAPFFHPGGKKIIFSSNHHSKKGYDFQLFMVNEDGTDLEQITNQSVFNAFPMFSPDGKKLIFSSNRNNGGTRDTNLFIADWAD